MTPGELRGQIVFSDMWRFDNALLTDLSGGNAVPTTASVASGSGIVVKSTDGTMGLAFLGVAGEVAASRALETAESVLSFQSFQSYSGTYTPSRPHESSGVATAPRLYPGQPRFHDVNQSHAVAALCCALCHWHLIRACASHCSPHPWTR